MTPEEERQLNLRRQQLQARLQAGISQATQPMAGRDIQSTTSMREQGMNGVNEGLSGLFGLPVDLASGAINLGTSGINAVAGTDIPKIENPAGGSGMFVQAMENAGAITENEPQTTGQRYARSIGQEAGGSLIPAAGALSRAAQTAPSLARFAGLEAASVAGAGIGAQAARDIAPDSPTAQTIAALIGGGLPVAGAYGMTRGPQAPSIDDLRDSQRAAYGRVEGSRAQLSTNTRDQILQSIQGRIAQEGVPEFLPQPVRAVASRAEALPDTPMVTDVEDLRRIVGNDLAGSPDAQTRRIGVDLKEGMDANAQALTPADLVAGDPDRVFADLAEGREMTRRIAQSEGISGETGAVTRATRRAASSGTGGNEVNAIRQNIRTILDNPRRRRQYSDEQLALMTSIVEGTPTTNTLRLLGRMSPTSGALPMMANFGAVGAAGATANPLLAAPGVVGITAQTAAENMTKRQTQQLDELIRNGAPLDPRRMTDVQRAALFGLGASQAQPEN